MATPAQTAANRANAQKSTGPQTPEGKAKSCLNHLSHGCASNTARLMQDEDPAELYALLADLTAEYQPATPTEQIFVEKMCLNQWLSLRAFRLQTGTFTKGKWSIGPLDISKDLGLLIRYHSTAERNFHMAHSDLVKAQKERKKSEIGFESQTAAHPAPNPPEPPRETTVRPEISIPEPPQSANVEELDSQLDAFVNSLTGFEQEIAKKKIEEVRTRRQAA